MFARLPSVCNMEDKFYADLLSHLVKYVCEPDGFEQEFNVESKGLLESLYVITFSQILQRSLTDPKKIFSRS